jgi:hypothetical protein
MSSSAQLLETLIKDTEKSLGSIEQRADVTEQVSDLEKKFEDAAKIKDDKERELRLKVLEADFRNLRDACRQEEQDLAQAVFGLNAILEGMGRDYMELGQLSDGEQGIVTRAESALAEAKLQRVNAEQKWNIFGRRAKALQAAESDIKKAEAGIELSKQEARRQARQRLMKADMEHSLQDFMHRVSKTVSIMENRMKDIEKQLKAVEVRKASAFDIKQKAAEALEKLDAELTGKESDLRREEEMIQTLVNGTSEHAAQTKKVSDLRADVEALRGRRNTAFVLFQSKEKFAAELEIHEKTQMKLRDNQRMWITSLRSDTEERVTTFRSRLEAMKAMSDQDVAKQLDDLGAAVDQSNAEYMAMAGAASDRVRMSKIENHPDRVAKIAKIQAHQAEAIQKIRVREVEAIEKFKKQYGIDPTKSSFFSYEDPTGQGGSTSSDSAGIFQ